MELLHQRFHAVASVTPRQRSTVQPRALPLPRASTEPQATQHRCVIQLQPILQRIHGWLRATIRQREAAPC